MKMELPALILLVLSRAAGSFKTEVSSAQGNLCTTPINSSAVVSGWYYGLGGQSCTDACDAMGLICTNDGMRTHNHEVVDPTLTASKITEVCGASPDSNCEVTYGASKATPSFQSGYCFASQSDKPVDCKAKPNSDAKQRLCFCDAKYTLESQPVATTGRRCEDLAGNNKMPILTEEECKLAAAAVGVAYRGKGNYCAAYGTLPGCYRSTSPTLIFFNADIRCDDSRAYGNLVCKKGGGPEAAIVVPPKYTLESQPVAQTGRRCEELAGPAVMKPILSEDECKLAAAAVGVAYVTKGNYCAAYGTLPGCYRSTSPTLIFFNADIHCDDSRAYGNLVCKEE